MTLRKPLLLLALASLTVSAFAHAKPRTMSPAANAIVASPKEVSVVFTEAVDPRYSSLQVTDAGGKVMAKAAATIADSGNHAHLSLPLAHLAPGTYSVHWVTAAIDGHRMDGNYTFTVK